jgi:predicted GNAT superfamily acetyltransferase
VGDVPHGGLEIEAVTTLAKTRLAMEVFKDAWGAVAVNDIDTYFAAASHGSYLGLGCVDGDPVVASFGLLSTDSLTGGPGLHSHMTAVKRAHADNGFGLAIKAHQRNWSRAHGIVAITWTFDPLQRRNAWFNLVRLGASVIGFHPNLYGCLGDDINGELETDRLEVRLDVRLEGGSPIAADASDSLVAIPDSIDELRSTDPRRAMRVQADVRTVMSGISQGTVRVRGMTVDRRYVISPVA